MEEELSQDDAKKSVYFLVKAMSLSIVINEESATKHIHIKENDNAVLNCNCWHEALEFLIKKNESNFMFYL